MAYDAVIIGGGHNGLVCACYLARAGLRVRVVERRPILGGAAVTEEFYPGFKNSTASYTVSLLNPLVIRDLNLKEHGLKIVERPLANFLPLNDIDSLEIGPTLAATQASFAQFSSQDAAALPEYYAMLERVSTVLKELALQTPPAIGAGVVEMLRSGRIAKRLWTLPQQVQRETLRLFTRSAAEILDSWFETDAVKAAFGFDSVVGNFQSPYHPGSAYVLLHHVFGEVNGKPGIWGHALGGMGSITQAMAAEARRLGVILSVDSPVSRVLVDDQKARGVLLEDGETIHAKRVASNVHPRLLFERLIHASDLPSDFRDGIQQYRSGSATLRMNVALSELPRFSCKPAFDQQLHHQAGIVIAPSLDYMDRAWHDARHTGWAKQPIVEMLIPSTVDDSLAPEGKHVASLFCQHFAPVLPNNRSWDEMADAAADTVLDTVNQYAPNFKSSILGRLILTPLDLERRFGLVSGDIFHGCLSLDQLYCARPVLGYGDYRSPIKNLFLCGSGTHPGGGVTGLPGRNAAREILRGRKPWRWTSK